MEKKTKAWAVIVGSNFAEIYEDKGRADRSSEDLAENYRTKSIVVPCIISYSIPSKGKKK